MPSDDSRVRVAVVIPCYDDGGFLLEALDSVRNQEEACEVVVIDDGSTDEQTLRVLDQVKRDGIRVISRPNSGPARARTAGVQATSAPYVHPLDADDRLARGALTTLADALDRVPEAQLAWGDYRSFGTRECFFPQAPQLDPWRITYLQEIPGTSMLRREAIDAVGGWNSAALYEDWDLWMRFAERNWEGVHVPQVTLLYREHASSRRYRARLAQHEQARALLRQHHHALYAARRRNWRRSSSPLAIKILFPLIDNLPGLPEQRKLQMYALARKIFEPGMTSDCYPSLSALIRRTLTRR